MIHDEKSPLAGKTVRLKPAIKHPQVPDFGGSEYRVEDWWDRITDKSWMVCRNGARVAATSAR